MRWEAVDDSTAHATLNDGPLTLKLLFRFNDDGMIDTVRAESRGRVVDGQTVNAPWQGRYWCYATQDGMRVPQEGEVAWLLPEGDKPYWRGTTLSASYEFANPPARSLRRSWSGVGESAHPVSAKTPVESTIWGFVRDHPGRSETSRNRTTCGRSSPARSPSS